MSSFAIFSYRIDANRTAPFVSTQIERHRSDFRPRFFGAVVFKFEPNLTYLPQKVDFCSKNCQLLL